MTTLEEQLAASPAAQGRDRMASAASERLMNLAYRALEVRRMDPMSFLIVCIAVDTRWRSLVDELMPDNEVNWQAERDRGALPVAMGIVMRAGLQDLVLESQPDLLPAFTTPPDTGCAHLIVLDDTGGTVYDVKAQMLTAG